ncbi:MAG: ATP-binding protein [Rhodospirillales bacterium]
MSRLFPKSLFGQTLLIMFAGLIVSHLIGAWIYASDREQAVRAVGGLTTALRIVNLTHLVEEVPADWQGRLVTGLSDPTFRVSLAARPADVAENTGGAETAAVIRDFIAERLSRGSEALRVSVAPATAAAPDAMPGRGMHSPPFRHLRHTFGGGWQRLNVAVGLRDGQWLSFATSLPETGPDKSWPFFVPMLIMAVIVIAVSVWAVRRVTVPIDTLARAAERLGKDVGAEPLAEIGTAEMRQASRAFNRMQDRLKRLIENRTNMLAAISHDLRTPLTLIKLRAEAFPESEDRTRILATVAEMEQMIGERLNFIRDETKAEERRPTDITSILDSIVQDMTDAGLPAAMEPSATIVCECQPAALKRAFTNLIDNAVKYGKQARVSIRELPEEIEIVVDDDGPGIPDEERTRVLQPFYRLEPSRSPETGGVGLGLAIAVSAIESHGGTLELFNRPEGGLRARVTLPR